MGVDNFSVFQEIQLQTDDPRVSNIVKFSETIGELKVEVYILYLTKANDIFFLEFIKK